MKTPNQSDKHTPGPWTWQRLPDRFRLLSAEGEETGLAVKILESEDEIWPNSANARLIAAAPELLSVLKRFAKHCEQHSLPELQGVACDVFAAIARAEGREP